jgi:tetratricopeptide (TPR) repeat protein
MIAALLLFLAASQVTPELRQHVEAGLKAKAAGNLDAAIREFKRVAELAPSLAAAHVNLGAVYLEKRDYANAIPELRHALELNRDLPGAHSMLGAALLAQGFAAEAIPHLEQGQSDDLLGIALLESGRVRDAVEKLEAALLKRPNDPDLLYYLGEAHGRLSKQLFDRVRKESPNSPRAEQLAGDEMAAAGNREGAEKHLRAALRLRPDIRGVHYALGYLYLESGDYEKAEPEFRAEARLVPGSAAAAYKLGFVLLNLGRIPEATAELKRANKLLPGMPETLLALGKAMNASGDTKAAEQYLKQVIAAENGTTLAESAHFQLAQIYRKVGRSTDAAREMKLFQDLRDKRK